jgi:hypothetical protein
MFDNTTKGSHGQNSVHHLEMTIDSYLAQEFRVKPTIEVQTCQIQYSHYSSFDLHYI